jgi:hypothetical protein
MTLARSWNVNLSFRTVSRILIAIAGGEGSFILPDKSLDTELNFIPLGQI